MTRFALIVSHGQPSDPAPAEIELAALAAQIGALMPGWTIGSATLAAPGALEQAMGAASGAASRGASGVSSPDPGPVVVFPLFMSDGYFIRTVLPRRLLAAGHAAVSILTPFGMLPATLDLAAATAQAACDARGWAAGQVTLVLAAHGSGVSRNPAEAAAAVRDHLARVTDFAAIRLGFIEEPPYLAEVLAGEGDRSICLPLFAARRGHVVTDVPEAVRAADYRAVVLPPIGTGVTVPTIIAAAIAAAT